MLLNIHHVCRLRASVNNNHCQYFRCFTKHTALFFFHIQIYLGKERKPSFMVIYAFIHSSKNFLSHIFFNTRCKHIEKHEVSVSWIFFISKSYSSCRNDALSYSKTGYRRESTRLREMVAETRPL